MVHEAVPKVELHCHLIGTLNAGVLRELKRAGQRVLVDPDAASPVGFDEGPVGFANWLERVEPYKAAGWRDYLAILDWHMQRLVAQGVVYAEMMISPLMFPGEMAALRDEFAEFQEWVRVREHGQLQMEFLFLVPRSLPEEFIENEICRCIALAEMDGICGISIAGLENEYPVSRFGKLFEVLKAQGLGIEIHAGELGGPEEVTEALDQGLADRIGHGIAAFQAQDLVQRLRDEDVHVEFCPTSNLKMGAVSEISMHPIGRARELGMNFSINTDDPGAFGCDMTSEFQLVESIFGFDKRDFEAVARNSLEARFQKRLRYPELFAFLDGGSTRAERQQIACTLTT
jgi:adenosine deaminase